MEYRTLGKTDLKVSRLGFGGAPIGIPRYLSPEDRDSEGFQAEVIAAIQEAVARGINYFDTAPGYGSGRSERLLGKALEGQRNRVIFATKYMFTSNWQPEQGTKILKQSLENLCTDYVDVLQFHGGLFNDEQAERILNSGVLDWADEMRGQGLCRFCGITAEGPSGALERLLRTGRFDTLLIAYNLIYQSCCDYQREPTGIIPLAGSLDMGVLAMRVTTCNFLQKLAAQTFPGVDPEKLTRLAINFVLSTPEVDCAVIGMRTVPEVQANLALAENAEARLDLKALHNRFE